MRFYCSGPVPVGIWNLVEHFDCLPDGHLSHQWPSGVCRGAGISLVFPQFFCVSQPGGLEWSRGAMRRQDPGMRHPEIIRPDFSPVVNWRSWGCFAGAAEQSAFLTARSALGIILHRLPHILETKTQRWEQILLINCHIFSIEWS